MSRDERSGHASPAFARMQCHLRHLRGRNWYATCHSPPRWSARERREACVPCSPQPALSTSSNDESFNAAERIFFFCVASWPPPNPAPDDFDPGFASTVYFRLGGIAIAHSFLRTPEVINFLLHMKSKQDHSAATETLSAMINTQAGLDRCNGGDRRDNGAWQPQRRCCQKERRTPLLLQGTLQIPEVPQLPQGDALLEQAKFVQREARTTRMRPPYRNIFDAVVVGTECGDAAVGDPVPQPFVPAVQHRAQRVAQGRVRGAAHVHHQICEAGVEAEDVDALQLRTASLERTHERVVPDAHALRSGHRLQVEQYAAALDCLLRERLDAQPMGSCSASPGVVRPDEVRARPEPVVVNSLRMAGSVHIEQMADMGKRIPLRRVLRVNEHGVVAQHIGLAQRCIADRQIEHGPAGPHRRRQPRRMTAWVQNIAPGKIQRQAKAEALPRSHLPDRAKHALGCDQVAPPELVVFPEIPPVRLGRPANPAASSLGAGHGSPLSDAAVAMFQRSGPMGRVRSSNAVAPRPATRPTSVSAWPNPGLSPRSRSTAALLPVALSGRGRPTSADSDFSSCSAKRKYRPKYPSSSAMPFARRGRGSPLT